VFHHANAFETPQGLVVDSIAYDSFPEVEPDKDFRETNFDQLDPGQLWRFQLDFASGQVASELVEPRCCEFPTMNPALVGQDCRYLYMGAADTATGNAPLQAIIKIDLHTKETISWSAAPYGFMSEPQFIPKPQAATEDDGWIVTLVYQADRDATDVVILEARDLTVIAKLHLPHHLPFGLHGSWTDETFLPG
jgi:all-trans-8'-apo-beta-carotenal 15,15'-oxygenase